MKDYALRAITVALNFIRERTAESSTRFVVIQLSTTGSIALLATVVFAFKNPHETGMVAVLVTGVGAVIAAGCVAIINRTQSVQGPPS